MSNKLYLECRSGISGDMTVAALLDLGADEKVLEEALLSLPVEGFQTEVGRVKKAGLDVCDFRVILDDKHESHDHDMKYLHGEVHTHSGEEPHSHGHHHEHSHRKMKDIVHLIEHAHMSTRAKETAVHIFQILADAEAKAHGVSAEEVHFHEVGAVDSIVDIIAVAVCLDNLGIEECIVPVLCEGYGTVRCQHGVLPIPVPAVANIVRDNQIKLRITNSRGEFVTPTGAAIVAAVRTSDSLPDTFSVKKIGMGAGKREYERPSILRAMLIEEEMTAGGGDCICKLESNIDDSTGENLGYVLDRLLQAGAKDVHYIPVFMKKNRPAYQLNVICSEEDIAKLEQIIFEETTTIGIRRQRMERTILKRREETVKTVLGEAKVKVCAIGSEMRYYPEYESVVSLCRMHGKSFGEVYEIIMGECNGRKQ